MSNLNLKASAKNTYDAIIVGSGATGGWAAKELTEKGLKVLMLERGKPLEHIKDYKTAMKHPWEFEHRAINTQQQKEDYPYVSRDYPFSEKNEAYWFKDKDAPYTEKKRFDWFRSDIVGGKSILWGRQSYRWSDLDFEANAKDGIATDWPIRYADIEPWYRYVEQHIGISGEALGLPQLPDSEFLPPMEMNCVEKEVRKSVESTFPERNLTIGRTANLTQVHKGRGACQYRNLCSRGCPYSAYFSTQSSTLPAAMATKRLQVQPNSIVSQIIYDERKSRAKGVEVIDSQSGQRTEYYAKVVFLCASTLGSTSILMNSSSSRFPNGFGNDSGQLGHNLMDHHFRVGASGTYPGFEDKYYYGRRPNGIYIPRFRNLPGQAKRDYTRGFGYQGSASRTGWQRAIAELGFGAAFKEAMTQPGPWKMGLTGFGECLPYYENKVSLNADKKDKWGLPTLVFDVEFKENEFKMRKDMKEDAVEMLEAAGFKDLETFDYNAFPGLAIHEMGTARMGKDPKDSVLNKWNQVHACKNVFVTDGSCMTSASCVNPTLTYMALTARAASYCVDELKKGNLK